MFKLKFIAVVILFSRLPEWAEEAIQPDGPMEYMAKYIFKLGSASPQLSKMKTGFILKEMMERFQQKIDSTLQPDRSLWLYSCHDFTISNVLESLGMFEVRFEHFVSIYNIDYLNKNIHSSRFTFSYIFHPMSLVCTLSCLNQKTMSTIFKSSIENQMRSILYL